MVLLILKCFYIFRRLCLYPKGNKKSNGEGYMSLYLQISDTENLPLDWKVTVNFKLFALNHINEEYLTVQGSIFLGNTPL